MKTSSIICQYYIFQALEPFFKVPGLMIIHFMDDIILAHPFAQGLDSIFQQVQLTLKEIDLNRALGNVQKLAHFHFL